MSKYFGGFIRNRAATKQFIRTRPRPFVSQQNSEIRGSGSASRMRLTPIYEKVTGVPFVPHYQEIGSCVGESGTLGAEFVTCIEIANGEREKWVGKYSVEVSYAISRVEIGGRKLRRQQDGSNGSWLAGALTQYGVLPRGVYGRYDLTKPRPDLQRDWGYDGCPDELEPEVKEHPLKTAALVESADEGADLITNGSPIVVCSNRGFRMSADRDGFLLPSGTWYHAMLITGVDTESDRPGFEIQNSWGANWVTGPKHKLGVAAGAFWADYKVVNAMLAQGDSYALSGFDGFPARQLDYLF